MDAAETMGAGASSGVFSTGLLSTIGSLVGIGLALTSGLGSAGRVAAIFSGAGSADLGAFSDVAAGVTSMAMGRKMLLLAPSSLVAGFVDILRRGVLLVAAGAFGSSGRTTGATTAGLR